MAGLTAVGAFVSLPIGPVPFSMQPLFVLLAGFVLGPVWGGVSIALYVAGGALGLPIFSGGASGMAVILGPTGGYLAGFVIGAALAGLARRKGEETLPWVRVALWGAVALASFYGFGLLQLKAVLGFDWSKALAIGLYPFILQDLVKVVLAGMICRYLLKQRLLPS